MKQTISDVLLFSFICFFIGLFIDYEIRENTFYLSKFLNMNNSSVYLVPIIFITFFVIGFYKASIKEHLKNMLFLLLLCFLVFFMQDFPPFIFNETNAHYILLSVYTYSVLAFLTSLFKVKNSFRKNNVSNGGKITKICNKNE